MATGSQPDSVFYGAYDKYVGEARTKPQVYGYWVLVVGLLAVLVGVLVFLLGTVVSLGLSTTRLNEISIALGAAGGIFLLLGSVLQLPLRRRAVYVAVLGAVLALGATGLFVRINPERWGFGTNTVSLAVVVGYAGGLSVVALVAALVPVVTGRRPLLLEEEPADELAWVVDEEDERREVSEVLLGESTRDGVFAVFPSDGGWRWRFVEQAAVADSTLDYETQNDAEMALETVREKVAAAGLLEVNHAAFRLYQDTHDGSESFRWALVDEDGVVLADSRDTYADRQKAERSVNMLKEHGPGAALLDVGDGAFEVYGDGEGGTSSDQQSGGKWRWRLVDADRTALGKSPRAFDERPDAESSVDEVRDLLGDAPLMDVEHVGFELVEDDGSWHWELKDSADTTVARSSDDFGTRQEAENSVKRLAEGAIDMPFLEATSPGYEVVEGADGGWRWRLVDGSDEVVARCERAVPSAESGRSVVSRVKQVVADADVLELPDAEFEVYRDGDEWAWRLVTEDREVVARSPNGDTFADPEDAMAVVEHVQAELEAAERIEFDSAAFHIYEAEDGGWNWRLVDSDGSLISDSAKQHASREDAAATMNTMKEHAPEAELVEIETSTLELYEADDEWHWRLVDAAGETLATSPGRHETADDAHDAMDALELLAPTAEMRTMNAAIFQVYVSESEPRQWRWRLIHPDGSVIATSADTFPDREQAQEAAEAVSAFADEATVHTISDLAVRFTVDVDEPPEDGEREEPVEMWHWHVVDRNRDEVALGTETFPSRDAVAATARLVRDHAGAATVFEVDPAAIRLDENDAGWFWRLVDENRETLAVGARAHTAREDARADLSRVRELAVGTELLDFDLAAFEVVERESGWAWQFVDTAGTVIGASPTYNSRQAAERALAEVRDQLRRASLLEIESPAFELHDDDGEWRWRLVDTDGATVAEGMRGYPTRREAREALESLRTFGGEAATEVAA
jgi:uncharacterized protein YegP (UPF0339 family)